MESPLPKACPRCGEPRILAPECPRCGVLYARAEARAAQLATRAAPPAPAQEEPPPPASPAGPGAPPFPSLAGAAWGGEPEDARRELRMRLFALPAALGVAWLLVKSPVWGGMLRIFLSMWVHELGHAVTAWFCGFPSMPGPWVTHTGEERSTVIFLMLATGLGGLIIRGYLTRGRVLMVAGATGLVLQFVGTMVLSPWKGQMLVTFGGDGGCLVLGSLLMTSLYARPDSALRRGQLHWGLLAIGAAAFMDAFEQWWAARTDFARIPFGQMENVGLSDPSKLVDVHHWGELQLIHRYNGLGLACLAALAVLYAVGLLRARSGLREPGA